MTDALFWHRLQFAFTITYPYLFPQPEDAYESRQPRRRQAPCLAMAWIYQVGY